MKVVLHYVWQACKTQDRQVFKTTIKDVLPAMKEEDVMYIHEMFKDEARAWAEKRGLGQGLEQKERETVQKMYTHGIPIQSIAKILDLPASKVQGDIDTITKN